MCPSNSILIQIWESLTESVQQGLLCFTLNVYFHIVWLLSLGRNSNCSEKDIVAVIYPAENNLLSAAEPLLIHPPATNAHLLQPKSEKIYANSFAELCNVKFCDWCYELIHGVEITAEFAAAHLHSLKVKFRKLCESRGRVVYKIIFVVVRLIGEEKKRHISGAVWGITASVVFIPCGLRMDWAQPWQHPQGVDCGLKQASGAGLLSCDWLVSGSWVDELDSD